ncbi:MAG: universal stress protein [Acidimicrobiales bacterium]
MGYVLVGLDGSDTSRKAFHEAVREATWRGTYVVAMHVVGDPLLSGYAYTFPDTDSLKANGKNFLAAEVDSLEHEHDGSFPVEVRTIVRIGHPGVQLIEAAKGLSEDTAAGSDSAELVVLGTRGYGGFRGLLVGSITTYAIHHLACRLLVVPADRD